MSEPIFRAYNNKTKEWIPAFFVNKDGQVCGFSVDITHQYQLNACIINHNDILDAVLCRSTGLRDRNGKMIFENDIIKSRKIMYSDDEFQIRNVVFIEGAFKIGSVNLSILDKPFYPEIIGNIFENSSLMEQKQNG